jgi:hypothetical protein
VDKLYQEISSFPWRNNNDEQLDRRRLFHPSLMTTAVIRFAMW